MGKRSIAAALSCRREDVRIPQAQEEREKREWGERIDLTVASRNR
jgi:hypothetical protein